MPKIQVNNLSFYYEQTGEGPDLVLISGLSCDHTMWDVNRFSDHFQVLTFDNRGVGQSEVPKKPYAMSDFAQDTAALCQALGIKNAHFVGHSMGGHIVQQIAASYPELVNKAVIACSEHKFSILSYLATKMEVELTRYNLPRKLLIENYLPFLFSPTFLEQKERVEAFVKAILETPNPQTFEGYLGQLSAIRDHDTTALLSSINSPTLIIGCEDDLLTPFKNSEYLKSQISKAQLVKIKECGHLPTVEKPDEFYFLIKSFLCPSA